MAGRIEARLSELGITLPQPGRPVANYVPVVIAGPIAYVSGQVSISSDGRAIKGKVGADVSVDEAVEAARICALNILAQLRDALGGNLDRVRHCLKLTGYVNAMPDFEQQPKVVNGASDLMVQIFGDQGRHARAAVGAGSLPLNVAVEVDAIFEIA